MGGAFFVMEANGVFNVSVRRTGGSTGAISVDYDVTSDTATAGTDFAAASDTLTWADGDADPKSLPSSISTMQRRRAMKHWRFD